MVRQNHPAFDTPPGDGNGLFLYAVEILLKIVEIIFTAESKQLSSQIKRRIE